MTAWRSGLESNGWRTSTGSPVLNRDLFEEAYKLDRQLSIHGTVRYRWISRNINQRADAHCNTVMDEIERIRASTRKIKIFVNGRTMKDSHGFASGAVAAIPLCMCGCGNTGMVARKLVQEHGVPAPYGQRVDLLAILQALVLMFEVSKTRKLEVTICSSAKSAVDAMTRLIPKWKIVGWRNNVGQPLADQDLYKKASELHEVVANLCTIRYELVPKNERLNQEALDQSRKCVNVGSSSDPFKLDLRAWQKK